MPSTKSLFSALLALLSVASATPTPRADDGLSLTAKIQLANGLARYDLLSDEDFIYTFSNESAPIADSTSFPALTGTGGALTVGKFAPCSVGFIHLHPRAAELFLVLSGTIHTEMVPEAGVRTIKAELGENQMTVFPMGAFHTQFNPTCETAVAIASFTSEDPGTGVPVAGTFALSDEIIEAAFGGSIVGEEIEKIRAALPKSVFVARQECLATCEKEKRSA